MNYINGIKAGIGVVGVSNSGVCTEDVHVYPQVYSGSPEYAAEYFSHCICGKKKKITTVTEVDVAPTSNKRGQE